MFWTSAAVVAWLGYLFAGGLDGAVVGLLASVVGWRMDAWSGMIATSTPSRDSAPLAPKYESLLEEYKTNIWKQIAPFMNWFFLAWALTALGGYLTYQSGRGAAGAACTSPSSRWRRSTLRRDLIIIRAALVLERGASRISRLF
jgi:hypothetical protein